MTLEEIRELVAGTMADDWRLLGEEAPTYLDRFVYVWDGGKSYLESSEHEARAVLRADVDIGLAWGLPDRTSAGEVSEPNWTKAFVSRRAQANVVEILYRGQPVDREVYGIVDNGHGLVPWPAKRFLDGTLDDSTDGSILELDDILEVDRWQLALVLLLKELYFPVVGSVDDYLARCGITVAD